MLDMVNNEVSVEQNIATEKTQITNENMVNTNGGVLATIETLHTSVKEWRELQGKADEKLYFVLDGCLRIIYMCESEGLKASLLSVCKDRDMKGMENKGTHLIVSKLVFGSEDKKCYTYAKALENATKLKLQTEENKQKLSEYLKTSGGIDTLIRKDAIAISKGYDDERFGTKEHFGETLCTELFGYLSGLNLCDIDKVKENSKDRGLSNIKIDDDNFMKMFVNKEETEQFVKLKYDYQTKTFAVIPYAVSSLDAEYNAISKAFNQYMARVFEGTKMYDKYIKQCDARDEKLKKEKAEKDKKILKELNKIAL
jgi:hypothetical protein